MKSKKSKIIILRERFIADYCKKKGWNPSNLSPNQLLEIVNTKEYLNPLG